ncbi:hypothetical protein VTK26DRAFT_6415 [Humicola hyalothermophila]
MMGIRKLPATFLVACAFFQLGVAMRTPKEWREYHRKGLTAPVKWWGPISIKNDWMTLYPADIAELQREINGMTPKEMWKPSKPQDNEWKNDYGPKLCGIDSEIASGNYSIAQSLLTQLRELDGYWTISESRCHRLACGENTGIYWCNDNPHGIRTSARAIFARGMHILDGCCQKKLGTSKQLISPRRTSGVEQFPDDHKEAAKSRVVVGYGSCADKSNVDPASYKYPGKLGRCDAW